MLNYFFLHTICHNSDKFRSIFITCRETPNINKACIKHRWIISTLKFVHKMSVDNVKFLCSSVELVHTMLATKCLSEAFLNPRIFQRNYIKNSCSSLRKTPVILPNFNEIWVLSTRFIIKPLIFKQRPAVRAIYNTCMLKCFSDWKFLIILLLIIIIWICSVLAITRNL
jgi:hypothetical protein